jgi:hypothetical protein
MCVAMHEPVLEDHFTENLSQSSGGFVRVDAYFFHALGIVNLDSLDVLHHDDSVGAIFFEKVGDMHAVVSLEIVFCLYSIFDFFFEAQFLLKAVRPGIK